MERSVSALFDSEEAATAAVQRLVDSGIRSDLVSALVHSEELRHEDLPLHETKAGSRTVEGTLVGAGLGAILGGILAGPAGLIGAGPLAAALFGASGGLYGAIAGAITGQDEAAPEVAELARDLGQGKVLVSVDVEGITAKRRTEELLTAFGGQRITVS